MGHTGPGVDQAYRPKDPEFYRKVYAEKAMPFLRLESSTPSETEKQIEELRGENAALKQRLNHIVASTQGLTAEGVEDLRKRIEEMEKKLKGVESGEKSGASSS
jgi:hypothetical protein